MLKESLREAQRIVQECRRDQQWTPKESSSKQNGCSRNPSDILEECLRNPQGKPKEPSRKQKESLMNQSENISNALGILKEFLMNHMVT